MPCTPPWIWRRSIWNWPETAGEPLPAKPRRTAAACKPTENTSDKRHPHGCLFLFARTGLPCGSVWEQGLCSSGADESAQQKTSRDFTRLVFTDFMPEGSEAPDRRRNRPGREPTPRRRRGYPIHDRPAPPTCDRLRHCPLPLWQCSPEPAPPGQRFPGSVPSDGQRSVPFQRHPKGLFPASVSFTRISSVMVNSSG